jgi:hypothetical protein
MATAQDLCCPTTTTTTTTTTTIAPCEASGDCIRPDVTTGGMAYFSATAAGTYRVYYCGGCLRFNPDYPWQLNGGYGFRIVYNGGNANIVGPGNSNAYSVEAECTSANIGAFVSIAHTGGSIGMYLSDSPASDNVAGTQSPTFCLVGPIE